MAADVSRREFVRLTVACSLGLLLGLPAGRPRAEAPHGGVQLHPLIHVGTDGRITLFAQNPDMGQGVKTSLPMIIAEELDVDWRDIRTEQADWDPALQNQFSGGSLSIRLNFTAMRLAGASAREMLMNAAADRFGVPVSSLATVAGQVVHRPSGRTLAYGELADAAAALPVPDRPALKPVDEFRLIGRPVPDIDLERIVTGQQVYSLDLELPDMLYAAVERCPVSDGQPVSFDGADARNVEGVVDVRMLRNRDFGGRIIRPNSPNFVSGVAVVATHSWAALEGARRLRVQWELPDTLDNSAELMERYREALSQPGEVVRDDAAVLSRELERPVKVIWTREDDIRHDYFRPSGLHRVRAGKDEGGRISAWHHKLVNHSRATYLERDGSPAEIGNYEFPAGFVPDLHFEYLPVPSRIPLGQWRAVDHSANVFVFASAVVDCGLVVNPDGATAQVEGAIVEGL